MTEVSTDTGARRRAQSAPAVLVNDDAAHYIGLAPITLRKMRWSGTGPTYLKLTDTKVGYLVSALDAWLTSRPSYHSTSEQKAAQRTPPPRAECRMSAAADAAARAAR